MQSDDPGRLNVEPPRVPADDTSRNRVALIVPRTLVKKVKDTLEAHANLDKNVKIRPATLEELKSTITEPQSETFLIPTKFSVAIDEGGSDILPSKLDVARSIGLVECEENIGIIAFKHPHDTRGFLVYERGCQDGSTSRAASASESSSMNPLARTIARWLHRLHREESNWSFARDAVLSYSWAYMIYPPLLLLPPTTISNISSIVVSKNQDLPKDLSTLWCLLSQEFRTSHIALNAPIPATSSQEASVEGGGRPRANVLRSPTGLVPLHGDFGPSLPPDYVPSITDFSSAFWCTARQNGIFQTWAPRHTMFSRGNISEKTRILNLEELTERQLGSRPEETSAVDLYAGIGYFAFSYAKAGVGKVLCWEINPWSIEGLRRGAKHNGWGVKVINDIQALSETNDEEERLIVFKESNEHAARRIAVMRHSIPRVRHVNCGLLPSSKGSWEVAVQVLDPIGGWIHAHENIVKADIESRTAEIVEIVKQITTKHWVQELELQWEVKCEHVEPVKSYAPGVMHCVLDISVFPTG